MVCLRSLLRSYFSLFLVTFLTPNKLNYLGRWKFCSHSNCGYFQVVLASVPDLSCGFARELFVEWAEDPRNSVIFTIRPSPETLARTLIDNLAQKTVEIEVRNILFFHEPLLRICWSDDNYLHFSFILLDSLQNSTSII